MRSEEAEQMVLGQGGNIGNRGLGGGAQRPNEDDQRRSRGRPGRYGRFGVQL